MEMEFRCRYCEYHDRTEAGLRGTRSAAGVTRRERADFAAVSVFHYQKCPRDHVLASVEELCGLCYDQHWQRVFEKPSLALMIGNSLLKCCSVKKRIAIRDNDQNAIKYVAKLCGFVQIRGPIYKDS